MSIKNNISKIIQSYQLKQKRFLLAVSGGIDSMVMLDIFRKFKYHITVAHVDYGFRSDSNNDANLVRTYCAQFDIPFYQLVLDGYNELASDDENNLQNYARKKRYQFFESIIKKLELDIIVTAHHMQDNVETVFFKYLKGTGYNGLSGMRILSGKLFRPFLTVTKAEIDTYATSHKIPFVVDSSNLTNNYDRNYIRNEIFPVIESRFPGFIERINGNIQKTQSINDHYLSLLNAKKNRMINKTDHSTIIDISRLQKDTYCEDLKLLLLEEFGFRPAQLNEFEKLMQSKNGAYLANEKFQWIKSGNRIVIQNRNSDENDYCIIENMEALNKGLSILLGNESLSIKISIDPHLSLITSTKDQHLIDLDQVHFPIYIRKVKEGDYFYPLGLNKKKKVRKFLIDEKVPVDKRNDKRVMVSGEKIVSVIGHRIDHRFRILDSTRQYLSIEIL